MIDTQLYELDYNLNNLNIIIIHQIIFLLLLLILLSSFFLLFIIYYYYLLSIIIIFCVGGRFVSIQKCHRPIQRLHPPSCPR